MTTKLSLPMIGSPSLEPAAPSWHDFTAIELPPATDAPEPETPQGAYNPLVPDLPLAVPPVEPAVELAVAELLAPAGGIDAAFAAFHYGADAIYLGLKKFSARAEAENFTLEELDEITAYAHSLEPSRRVFVTINTLIRQDELAELIETLAALVEIGVDAVIVQDLGVYWAVRRHFPELELHASTQMAVHNRAGAEILKKLGFSRVVLARELTFEEVRDITSTSGIETEVFIHGALCYSYSGLCLFSAQTLGRSGNRGKCAYSCRDSFEVTGAPTSLRDGTEVKRDPSQGFPFSMKDLALPDHIPALRSAGVSCFKIEGRKKSPLYVATTTDYYRKLMDGTLTAAQRPIVEADLHTVFSRPWTRLFVQSHKDKEVADRDTVGHRGSLIGSIEAIIGGGHGRHPHIRFRTSRALEQHDGLQIDLPSLGKPFGFAIEKLWIVNEQRKREAFEAPAGAVIEVPLPDDYPTLPLGAPVYCSSSQAVKQKYRFARPKPGLHRGKTPLNVHVSLTKHELVAQLVLASGGRKPPNAITARMPGPFAAAQDAAAMEIAVREAFSRLGSTAFTLNECTLSNPDGLFVPASRLNQVRRDAVRDLEIELAAANASHVLSLQDICCPPGGLRPPLALPTSKFVAGGCEGGVQCNEFCWSIKIDRIGYVDAFTPDDWHGIDEVIIDIARDHPTLLAEKLQDLAQRISKDRIRLALPPLTRKWEEKGLQHKIAALRSAGWNKWEAGNLSAWSFLGLDPRGTGFLARPADSHRNSQIDALGPKMDGLGSPSHENFDLATDWSVYVINRLAALQLLDLGVTRFALSPEDGLGNLGSLLAEFASNAVVIVHQDTPLFLAESCAYANLIGGCPGKANCKFESMEMVSHHGEKVTALDYHCRTIVLNQGPFCLSTRLPELAQAGAALLRADFVYRPYQPDEVRARWRQVRAGQLVPGGHFANFERGVL